MNKHDRLYIGILSEIEKMSFSTRKKVAAILVKNNNIISFGWNGTPSGFDNCCEDKNNNTLPEVIHAEENVICKAAKMGISTDDSTLYLSLSPCFNCSKLIIQAGIKRVLYKEEYRDIAPLKFLQKANIIIEKYINMEKI